jgi:hypothetical protein
MAVSAQAGTLGFGAQTGKGSVATTWYRHRASDVDLASLDDQRTGPPEVGGQPMPTIPYKGGVAVAGGAIINPRLEDTLGWLLYGAMGSVSSSTSGGTIGVHVFAPDTNSPEFIPWMSFRKHVTGLDGDVSKDIGEIYQDCKLAGFVFNLPNDGLISARLDALGRIPSYDEAPTAWSWSNTFEDYQSLPIGVCTGGYIKVPSFSASELPVVSATVGIVNQPLPMNRERIYGSPYMRDITIVGRQLSVDLVLQWEDPNLYRAIHTGSSSGASSWSCAPFTRSLQVLAQSPSNMSGETEPYSLQVDAAEVMLSVQGGIRLAGNDAVMLRLTGVALAQADPADYASFTLKNLNTTGYTWPT